MAKFTNDLSLHINMIQHEEAVEVINNSVYNLYTRHRKLKPYKVD